MPRVTTHTKNRGGKKVYSCVAGDCKLSAVRGSREIRPGDRYYEWSRRFGRSGMTYRQHVDCGYPKPTQLSSAKTAVIVEAISDAETALADVKFALPEPFTAAEYEGGGTFDLETDEIDGILAAVADTARYVASEYEDGVNNMPDALQQGPTGEAMKQVSEELNDWADSVEDWAGSAETSVDVPDPADHDDEGAWLQAVEEEFERVAEGLREAAEEALQDMPEYQG